MASAAHSLAVARVLAKHVSSKRLRKLAGVLNFRVADTALVFENVVDGGNVSACLRTADALGVQRVCIIERWAEQSGTPLGAADKGSTRWLSVQRFASTDECVRHLRGEGFAVHATDLGPGAVDLATAIASSLGGGQARGTAGGAPVSQLAGALHLAATRPRVAVAFGNEHRGCSRTLLAAADVRFFMPQRGFVQSLNLSVACALVTHSYLHRTPDYAARSLAAHAHLQALNAASPPPDASAAGGWPHEQAPPLSVAAAAAARRKAAFTERTASGGQDDLEALLAGDAPPAAPPGAGGCEGLALHEKAALLARFLMADVTNADKILARAGVRPDDY